MMLGMILMKTMRRENGVLHFERGYGVSAVRLLP
jgi:hypothetical protein